MINAPDGWDPSLDLGVPEIDEQHRALFTMIVELDERITRDEFGQGVLDALQGMVAYAATHFEEEENLMLQAGWPGVDAHRSMHADFMQKTSLFKGEALIDSEWTSLDVLRYLLKWLVKHIKLEDRAFFSWRGEG
ncbi:bacteriohemerythrin [Fundidesulfovibrio terrae]|uniref:bacteriohemerythrin n=1 Tax=Fundidesulfovibrio terrae TaxID=2922866 RepID=UPI001FAF09D5|nr:bacteriohemerythrin [Fundidesulfovibrio terrae]